MLLALTGFLAIAVFASACFSYGKNKNNFGHLSTTLCGVLVAAFFTQLRASGSSSGVGGVLPWVVFLLGLIAVCSGVILHVSSRTGTSRLRKLGIVDIWPNRESGFEERDMEYLPYCRTLIREAPRDSRIRLLSTAGDGVAVVKDGYMPAFRDALMKGCRVQVILMDPCSPNLLKKQEAEDRSGLYGEPRGKGAVGQKIRDKFDYLSQWAQAAQEELSVSRNAIETRCINDMPVVNLIDNGEKALIALQVINRKGKDSPVFLVDKNGALYRYVQDHFDFLFSQYSRSSEEAARQFDEEIKPSLGEISEEHRTI